MNTVAGTTYDTNTVLSDSGDLSGEFEVIDNSTLEVSGNYTILDETSFTIEEGSKMIVSGQMLANSPPQLNIDVHANVTVPIGDLGPEGVLRIIFADPVYYNITIEINGSSQLWKGETFNYTGNMDVDNITINISHCGCFGIIAISEIQLAPLDSTPETREPAELTGNGTSLVIPTKTKSWKIDVYGELEVTGEIYGAEINCYGSCAITGADLSSTGPINAYGSISVSDSTLNGGITDEDIIVWDDATITWDNSVGSGGTTDHWVRILSTRTVGVQNNLIVFYGYEMGYSAVDTSPIADDNSDSIIDLGINERARIVEWQDSNGDLHSEDANGKIVFATPWGTYEKEIAELPRTNHFDVTLDLPLLSFDSLVESADENNVDSRLGVMATVTNNGAAPATFLIDCTSNGTDANVGVNVPYTANAGETIEIPMNWDSAVEGELTLECTIFEPYHFDGTNVVSSGTATTNPVTWSNVEDSSTSLLLPITIGVVLAIGAFVFMFRKNMAAESLKEHLTEIVEDEVDTDEDTGVIE